MRFSSICLLYTSIMKAKEEGLDVIHRSFPSCRIANMSNRSRPCQLIQVSRIPTVSYTHLDVYKRQQLPWLVRPDQSRLGNSHLYLSRLRAS